MFRAGSNRIAIGAILAVFLSASINVWARAVDDPTSAGTIISNRAEATYQDAAGESFSTVSSTVTITIATVAAVVVTPDETSPSNTVTPNQQVTRLFRVCNAGNTPD